MNTSPLPFRQFVLKVHSRCDLACDHCYVYEHADTSWRGRPKAVSDEVLARTSERIADHARSHGLTMVHVVLHGGEPLLAGPGLLRRAGELLHKALDGVCGLDLRIHTNGVLLSERYCELFLDLGIKVGISLDGDRAANDLHRRYADGRSSHAQVIKAVELLQRPRYRPLFAGLLCTIDVRNDPLAVYDALLELDPPRIDFLLPHATWDNPPLRPEGQGDTPYADWLKAIHDRWDAQGRPVPVRMFDSVLSTLRGGPSLTESLGLDPADLVVIETDGELEQADSLKTAFDGAPATGFNVFDHDLDTAARHPGMIDRQLGLASLAEECRSCPVVRSCGGGLYAHRYRTGTGFDNPSVFCADLKTFIGDLSDLSDRGGPSDRGDLGDRGDLRDGGTTGRQPTVEPAEQLQQLAPWQLDELATGYGGAETVAVLADLSLERSRELLAEVRRDCEPTPERLAAWQLLAELDADHPDSLDEVLAHPYTRLWAVRCKALQRTGDRTDLGGLAEIAAAAVLRAGVDAAVEVRLRGGVLRLPGLGRVLLGGTGRARVTADRSGGVEGSAGFTVEYAGETLRLPLWSAGADPRWEPLRGVGFGQGRTVLLEDTDPYRDGYPAEAADRLDPAECEAWAAGLAGAWQLIPRALPAYAPGLAAGLTMITPLRAPEPGREVSAALRDAFGVVGIARPAAEDSMALLLVHEFQHVKLGAVLDLQDLFDRSDRRLFRAPWRPDPRPLEGLFQGTYAHVGVSEYWASRVRDHREPGSDPAVLAHAEARFARWRRYTVEAIETLSGSGALTPLGLRFAAGMRSSMAPLLEEPVNSRVEAAVELSIVADEAAWSAEHGVALQV